MTEFPDINSLPQISHDMTGFEVSEITIDVRNLKDTNDTPQTFFLAAHVNVTTKVDGTK